MTNSPLHSPGHHLPVGMYLTSSFTEHLRTHAPELLPQNRVPLGQQDFRDAAPHGTTIVAVSYPGGVVLAGDRRATMGNLIASRDMRKVYVTDEHSAAGIAGTAGIAIEMVRLFTVELEHYEKIEGFALTLDGKANRLSSMVRGNMGLALQGLAAIPILVGVDPPLDGQQPGDAEIRRGRIFSFDVTGDRHEEHLGYQAIGSGSVFAKSSLKKLYRDDLTAEQALAIAVEALYDAADDDSATGGPDLTRGLFPTAVQVSTDGAEDVDESRISRVAHDIITRRTLVADGTSADERDAER